VKFSSLNNETLVILGTLYSVSVIILTGHIYFTLLTSASLSVFFLLLDRCMIIAFPAQYSGKYKAKFEKISPILVILNFGLVSGVQFYIGLNVREGYTTCLSAGCLTDIKRNRTSISIIVKFLYAVLNLIVAVAFAATFVKYNKTRIMVNPNSKRLATNF
jgi:hypothetical protein